MKQESQIQVRLVSVSEVKFMLNLDEILLAKSQPNGPNIGFAHAVSINKEDSTITLIFGVQYAVDETPLLESRYAFTFNVSNIGDIVKIEKDKIEIKELMPHFVSVAIGTMRGIIVAKTAGTSLAKYPLPMLDAKSVLENMVANMQKEQK